MADKYSISPALEKSGITVRVYGIMINDNKDVLVSDEYYYGRLYTKFPGGGMKFGETTRDCVIREWLEELDQPIITLQHIYTSDIIQAYPFRNDIQVLSVYYLVQPLHKLKLQTKDKPFDFDTSDNIQHIISTRWIDWQHFSAKSMTLPSDKVAASTIKEHL